MVEVFCDTNILQDIIAKRPSTEASAAIFALVHDHNIHLHMSVLSVPILVYVNRKERTIKELLQKVLSDVSLEDLSPETVIAGLEKTSFPDYEDFLQHEAARESNCQYIVTRNLKDYTFSQIPVVTPERFIQILKQESL